MPKARHPMLPRWFAINTLMLLASGLLTGLSSASEPDPDPFGIQRPQDDQTKVVEARSHPGWSELKPLLGQPKGAAVVRKLVTGHALGEITKGPSGAFTAPDHAYSLLYRKNVVSTIILRVKPFPKESSEPHWRSYQQSLPAGLSASDTPADVLRKLGAPVKNRRNTFRHKGVHLWVMFSSKTNTIDEIYVSQQPTEAKRPRAKTKPVNCSENVCADSAFPEPVCSPS